MSSFGRSFTKSPTYLSQYSSRRPQMGGRTFSNSSERSLDSDSGDRPTYSGRTTPQAYQSRLHPPPTFEPSVASGPSAVPSQQPSASSSSLSASNTSSPIAIELPRATTRIGSAPVYTPPEPLSARGDLPGGYFPNHEDPKSRVQRTHPFHRDKKDPNTRTTASNPVHDAAGSYRDHRRPVHRPYTTSAMSTANVPVASYFPTGYHDTVLPMGKYYPSNYERAHGQSRPTSATPSSPADIRSPGSTSAEAPDSARQVQLQQYQRQMLAQTEAAMRASQKETQQSGSLGLNMRLNKPNAPRLHPLGSPGPVTPMELESSGATSAGATGAGGNYLDKGNAASRRSSHAGLTSPESTFSPRLK